MNGYQISGQRGVTLVELMISLSILTIVLAGVYSMYAIQVQQSTREYRMAEGEMEMSIAKNIIERDLIMAGYGLADDYGAAGFAPRGVAALDGGAGVDRLTLMGTALGIESREPQGWTFVRTVAAGVPTFQLWGDNRENVQTQDQVIAMEPGTKRLVTQAGGWVFTYQGTSSNVTPPLDVPPLGVLSGGLLMYGVQRGATVPYATVVYSLGSAAVAPTPPSCAQGAQSLLRSEYWTAAETAADPVPLESCVLDFQVAFGLDTDQDDNGTIDFWDNGGTTAATYSPAILRKRVKQTRLYMLIQSGNRDPNYTYPAASIRVGDAVLGTGRDFALSSEQRRFRWKMVGLTVASRNVR